MPAEDAIKTEVIAALNKERITELESRHTYGRAIMALQAMNGDVKAQDGRPTFVPAIELVAGWAKDANVTISGYTLKHCLYIAQRLSKGQVDTLAKKGMTFYQVFGMVSEFKGNVERIRNYVGEVRTGKATDFAKFYRGRGNSTVIKTLPRSKNGDETTSSRIDVDLYDKHGNFDTDKLEMLVACLWSTHPALMEQANKQAMKRLRVA